MRRFLPGWKKQVFDRLIGSEIVTCADDFVILGKASPEAMRAPSVPVMMTTVSQCRSPWLNCKPIPAPGACQRSQNSARHAWTDPTMAVKSYSTDCAASSKRAHLS